jgi:hypothetical protein
MSDEPNQNKTDDADRKKMTDRQVYNVVTDTVGGPNIRARDNIFQAIFIAISVCLAAGIGALLVEERVPGALVGAVLGLIVGVLGSGIILMIFRAVMHLRGRHD